MTPSMVDLQIESLSALPFSKCEVEGDKAKYQLVEFTSCTDQMGKLDYRLSFMELYQIYNSGLALATAMLLAINDLRITKASIKKQCCLFDGREDLRLSGRRIMILLLMGRIIRLE